MELWDRLYTLSRMMRGYGLRHYELNERLQMALEERANQEQRPAEEIQEELLAAGLDHLKKMDGLKECWGKLSRREQEVTAYTCLGYTNRQIAARMNMSPLTIKDYVGNTLDKFHLHSKDELRRMLMNWDFSEWGPRAEEEVPD